jgi:translocation protein SEC63
LLSAASFFKSLKEESSMEEVIVTMGNVYQWELPTKKLKAEVELDELEKAIEGRMFNHEVEGD